MPRVKKCSGASRILEVEETLPTIQTMQFVDSKDTQREASEQEMNPDKTEQVKMCPLCHDPLQYNEITTQRGTSWCYYRCPSVTDFTKCFVASSAEDVDLYLDRVKQTLHPMFESVPNSFDPANMRCYCNKSLILAMSESDKNKHRLYFKCPKRECSFFQWGDSQQRHKPYDLAEPIQRQRRYEARLRC